MKRLILMFLCVVCMKGLALEYKNRNHTLSETLIDQGIVFTGHTLGYLATQSTKIKNDGSFKKYENNFLKFRFDGDNTTWNFIGHTYTGSQVYLYYRARGYNENKAFYLSFLSSLWFEVFIETYTEKPSFQDTFNTPFFGSILGHYMEKASVSLINTDNTFYKIIGRILNPFSLIKEDNNMALVPSFRDKDNYKITWTYYYD